jgi:hypothetical protein
MDRLWYVVGAYKIAPEERDVAQAFMTPENDYRNFFDIIDADDDPNVPLGAEVAYRVDLTPDEADEFADASNCRYVEVDLENRSAVVTVRPPGNRVAATSPIPPDSTMKWMGADPFTENIKPFHGKDVPIGVCDGGTTKAVRDRFGWTITAAYDFARKAENTGRITTEHGCYVTPEAVPAGGLLVEAIVFSENGGGTHSMMAAGFKFCADKGARVINYSGGGSQSSNIERDALNYLRDRGVVLICAAGNDGDYILDYPAKHCEDYPNVFSSIAFDEATDDRADFSNHYDTGSGAAPGSRCLSVNQLAQNIRWSGTSSSSPKMARLVAMGATGGRFTTLEIARALVVNARNTEQPPSEEGAGPWFLQNVLTKLGAWPLPAPTPPPATKPPVVISPIDPTVRPTDPTPAPQPPTTPPPPSTIVAPIAVINVIIDMLQRLLRAP